MKHNHTPINLRVVYHKFPLLFLLYINDLPLHTKFHVNLFADNTVQILKSKNVDQLQQILDEELSIIDEWMKFNRLSMSYLKTTYFIIAPKSKKSCSNKLRVKIGEQYNP